MVVCIKHIWNNFLRNPSQPVACRYIMPWTTSQKGWDASTIHVEKKLYSLSVSLHVESLHGQWNRSIEPCQSMAINWRIQSQSLISNYLLCGDERNYVKHINDIDTFPFHSCIQRGLRGVPKSIQWLTHWGRVNINRHWFRQWFVARATPIFISANTGILLIGPIETYFSEISIEIYIFSLKKMHLKMSFWKMAAIFIGLNMLKRSTSVFSKTTLWLLHSFKLIVMTSSPVNGPFSQIKQCTSPISQKTPHRK